MGTIGYQAILSENDQSRVRLTLAPLLAWELVYVVSVPGLLCLSFRDVTHLFVLSVLHRLEACIAPAAQEQHSSGQAGMGVGDVLGRATASDRHRPGMAVYYVEALPREHTI